MDREWHASRRVVVNVRVRDEAALEIFSFSRAGVRRAECVRGEGLLASTLFGSYAV